MKIDVMAGAASWADTAALAQTVERAGFSGLLFTETSQTPFMQITAAALAAPTLELCTGIAVAFPRSPMMSAAIGWELAANTGGKFRLGLGSQVRAHVERRYGAEFDPVIARMSDYVAAVKACLRAFRRDERLSHSGRFYEMSLLPTQWAPEPHDHPVPIDISAVGPQMLGVAGELADGVHVHPFHSAHYLEHRLEPALGAGLERAGRDRSEVDLIVPVFAVGGDTVEERESMVERARSQIAFYGSTKNYAMQFDDLGFDGTSGRINERLKAGDIAGMSALVTDDMLDHYAVVGPWAELGHRLVERYRGRTDRLVMYLTAEQIVNDPETVAKWAAVADTVRAA